MPLRDQCATRGSSGSEQPRRQPEADTPPTRSAGRARRARFRPARRGYAACRRRRAGGVTDAWDDGERPRTRRGRTAARSTIASIEPILESRTWRIAPGEPCESESPGGRSVPRYIVPDLFSRQERSSCVPDALSWEMKVDFSARADTKCPVAESAGPPYPWAVRAQIHMEGTITPVPAADLRRLVPSFPEAQPERNYSMAVPTVSMHQLIEAGAHFGHQTHRWNPRMKPYIFGSRNGVPHHRPVADRAAVRARARLRRRHRPPGRQGAVRRHQAPGAGADRRGRARQRPALRQPPLARRHADQLEDHFRLDQAPQERSKSSSRATPRA